MANSTLANAAEQAMYFPETWATLLNSKKAKYQYVLFKKKDKPDFVTLMKGNDDKFSVDKVYQECGLIMSCEPFMSEPLVTNFNNRKVSRIQTEVVINKKPRIFFLIGKNDVEQAQIARQEINMASRSIQHMDFTAFKEEMIKRGSDVATYTLDKLIFEVLNKRGAINFPHTYVDMGDAVKLYMPAGGQDREDFEREKMYVEIEYSGRILENAKLEKAEKEAQIQRCLSELLDDQKMIFCIDKSYPDNYVWSDSKSYHIVQAGAEVKIISRTDTRDNRTSQELLYNELDSYHTIDMISCTYEEGLKHIEDLKKLPENTENTLDDKIHRYVRLLITDIADAIVRKTEMKVNYLYGNG